LQTFFQALVTVFLDDCQVLGKTQLTAHPKTEADKISCLYSHVGADIRLFARDIGKLSLILTPDNRFTSVFIAPQNHTQHVRPPFADRLMMSEC
jgi:hypothetical protein